jgi:lipopolysaccharide biosynthesis glycosyltransferase
MAQTKDTSLYCFKKSVDFHILCEVTCNQRQRKLNKNAQKISIEYKSAG